MNDWLNLSSNRIRIPLERTENIRGNGLVEMVVRVHTDSILMRLL